MTASSLSYSCISLKFSVEIFWYLNLHLCPYAIIACLKFFWVLRKNFESNVCFSDKLSCCSHRNGINILPSVANFFRLAPSYALQLIVLFGIAISSFSIMFDLARNTITYLLLFVIYSTAVQVDFSPILNYYPCFHKRFTWKHCPHQHMSRFIVYKSHKLFNKQWKCNPQVELYRLVMHFFDTSGTVF